MPEDPQTDRLHRSTAPWYAYAVVLVVGMLLLWLPGTLVNAFDKAGAQGFAEFLGAAFAGAGFGAAAFGFGFLWPGHGRLWGLLVTLPASLVLLGWLARNAPAPGSVTTGVLLTLTLCVGLAVIGGHRGVIWRRWRHATRVGAPSVETPEEVDPSAVRWLPLSAVPTGLSGMLNPDMPLGTPERFLPSNTGSLWSLAYAAFWFLVLGGLSTGLFFQIGASTVETQVSLGRSMPGALAALLCVLCALGAYRNYLWIRRIRGVRSLKRQGRYREGLFVLDDGLLVHRKGSVLFVPRDAIAGFVFRYRRGEPNVVATQVRDAAGAVDAVNLDFIDRYGGNLISALEHWFNTGEWRPPEF